MAIPISADVAVVPQVLSAGGSSLAFNGHFLTNNPAMQRGTTLAFPNPTAAIAYFGPLSTETQVAAVYFQGFNNSDVKPASLLFSAYATAPTVAFIRGGNISGQTLAQIQAINGTLSLPINGATASGTVNLSGATSFSGAAQIIGTALGVVATYDSTSGAFGIFSTNAGSTSTIDYATGTAAAPLLLTQATGATTSQGSDADSPAAAMDAIVARSTNWASFTTTFEPALSDKLAFAAWNSAQGKRYRYVMWDTDINTATAGSTESAAYQATQVFRYDGVVPVYAPVNGVLVGAFGLGYPASLDFSRTNGRTTFKFRSLDGLPPDVTDATVMANVIANGANAMGQLATANQLFTYMRNGTVGGQFAYDDSYVNAVWLDAALQLALVNLLVQAKSVPYAAPGYGQIEASLLDPVQAALNFGAIRVGVALSNAEASALLTSSGKDIANTITNQGFYILVQDPGALVRGVRGSPVCALYYADGGSIQMLQLTSTEIQ